MSLNATTRDWIRSAVGAFFRGELTNVLEKVLKPKDSEPASVVTEGQDTTDGTSKEAESCTPTET